MQNRLTNRYSPERWQVLEVQKSANLPNVEPDIIHDDGRFHVWITKSAALDVYYVSGPRFDAQPVLAFEPGVGWHSLYPRLDDLAKALTQMYPEALPGKSSNNRLGIMQSMVNLSPRHASPEPIARLAALAQTETLKERVSKVLPGAEHPHAGRPGQRGGSAPAFTNASGLPFGSAFPTGVPAQKPAGTQIPKHELDNLMEMIGESPNVNQASRENASSMRRLYSSLNSFTEAYLTQHDHDKLTLQVWTNAGHPATEPLVFVRPQRRTLKAAVRKALPGTKHPHAGRPGKVGGSAKRTIVEPDGSAYEPDDDSDYDDDYGMTEDQIRQAMEEQTRGDDDIKGNHLKPDDHEGEFESLYQHDPEAVERAKSKYWGDQNLTRSNTILYQGSTDEALADVRKFGLLSRNKQRELRGGKTQEGVGFGRREDMSFDVDYNPSLYVHVTSSSDGAARWANNAMEGVNEFRTPWKGQSIKQAQAIVFTIKPPVGVMTHMDPASGSSNLLIRDRIPPEWITGYSFLERHVAENHRTRTRNAYYTLTPVTPLDKGDGGQTLYAVMMVMPNA